MKALVTGGAGFIGSHLVDRLLAEGWLVEVADNLATGSLSNLAEARSGYPHQVRFSEIDIRSSDIDEYILRCAPDVVFHLAAQADVRVSVANPVFDADVNVMGSIRVIEAARKAGTRKLIYAASGGTLYGDVDPKKLPIKEAVDHHPLSPYGVSKKAVYDYLVAYRELHGFEFTALALANVYGPRQDPHGEAGVVAIFAGLMKQGVPCTIFGDGNQTRDFIFVDDVVDAFSKAASAGDGAILNVGTGTETSVNTLFETMAKVSGSQLAAKHEPERPGELARSALNPDRAKSQLGWEAWTGLEDGTAAVIRYTRDL